MPITEWKERFDTLEQTYKRWVELGRMGERYPIRWHVGPPATLAEIEKAEKELGFRLPSKFRDVFLNFSGDVDIFWAIKFSASETVMGECVWNLPALVETVKEFDDSIESFADETDEEIRNWLTLGYGRKAFFNVKNGDCILVTVGDNVNQEIVYFSHDSLDLGEGHGAILGKDFEEFIDHWSRLAFVGPDFYGFQCFLGPNGFEPDKRPGQEFQKWFFGVGQ